MLATAPSTKHPILLCNPARPLYTPAGRLQGIHYAGVFLAEPSRDRVLQHAPPLHESVSADHMTLAYRPSLEACLELPLGEDAPLFVEGVAADYRAQVGGVRWGGWVHAAVEGCWVALPRA